MKDLEFPVFKTKKEGITDTFDLTSPEERKAYFEAKAGPEIQKLRDYLSKNTFIAYFLGKKNSGKGTYSKMFREILGGDYIEHLSIGDMVREFDKVLQDKNKKEELITYLKENYRGFMSIENIIASMEDRSTETLLPSELVLALIKKTIAEKGRKAFFIDGFPRELDQISYSLFFRDLINYREDPDVFILIDLPDSVIDERIKYRRICPECQTSRSLKLLPTKEVGWDEEKQEYYLKCDNPECSGPRMVQKEGDEKGTAPIQGRLEKDEQLIRQAFKLYGIPKVLLRNTVPVETKDETTDDYELTPEYYFEGKEEVTVHQKPLKFMDENNVECYSLMPPPVVLSLIGQLVEALKIK